MLDQMDLQTFDDPDAVCTTIHVSSMASNYC